MMDVLPSVWMSFIKKPLSISPLLVWAMTNGDDLGRRRATLRSFVTSSDGDGDIDGGHIGYGEYCY